MVGIFAQSESEFFLCVRVVDFVVVNLPQSEMDPRKIRIPSQHFLVISNRFWVFFLVRITFGLQNQHEICIRIQVPQLFNSLKSCGLKQSNRLIEDLLVVGIFFKKGFVLLEGFAIAAQRLISQSLVVTSPAILWV